MNTRTQTIYLLNLITFSNQIILPDLTFNTSILKYLNETLLIKYFLIIISVSVNSFEENDKLVWSTSRK